MDKTISTDLLVEIVEKSDLDPTIKEILIRDIKQEGVNEFYVEQVLAFCDNAEKELKEKFPDSK